MRSIFSKFCVIYFLFATFGFTQEALFNAKSTGLAISGLYTSGNDYRSRGVSVLFLHKGSFFFGYQHDQVEIWLRENSNYSEKIEQPWDFFYLGFRNFEKPEKKQIFSFTFQIGYAFSNPNEPYSLRSIPLLVTFSKQLSTDRLKLVPLVYGTYVYLFTYYDVEWLRTTISTDYSYGFQLNVVVRPVESLNHGVALGLDFNLKNTDVPIAFQFSLVFNAFKEQD